MNVIARIETLAPDLIAYNKATFRLVRLSKEGLTFRAPPGDGRKVAVVPHLNTIWDLAKFGEVNAPVSIGHVRDLARFSTPHNLRVLDMPIKFPGSEYRLPREILPWEDTIRQIAVHEAAMNPQGEAANYCYVTIDQQIVVPGASQRKGGLHVDGFQGARIAPKLPVDHSYVVSDREELATVFYPQAFPVAHLDEARDDFFLAFDELADPAKVWRPAAGEIAAFNAYAVHGAVALPEDAAPVARTFLRMSFTVREFDRLGNTHNPMFDYTWDMQPREIHSRLRRPVLNASF